MRIHLGVETKRQWSDAAIERTTTVLLALYSLVCLWAGKILNKASDSNEVTWLHKSSFTFSDAITAVRAQLWLDGIFQRSVYDREWQNILPRNPANTVKENLISGYNRYKVPPERILRMIEMQCYAA